MIYFSFIGFERLNGMGIEEMNKEIIDGNLCIADIWYWALKSGRLDIVKELSSRIEECPGLLEIVAENGHLEMLKWLYDNRKEYYSGRALVLAASNGHFECMKWLYNNSSSIGRLNSGIENPFSKAITMAAGYGHLNIVKWLYYNTEVYILDPFVLETAKIQNHTKVVNWLENEVCGR